MKVMAMGAAAIAALLMSAAPAAAQKVDPNAMCVIVVTEMTTIAEQHAEELSDETKTQLKYFRNAMHFHTGVLHARYSDDLLVPVMKASFTEYQTIPSADRPALAIQCIQEEFKVLKIIADGLRN